MPSGETHAIAGLAARGARADGDIGFYAAARPNQKPIDICRTMPTIRRHERSQADQTRGEG